jgi:16S rRNA (cytosine967-C5)-methyltransferase
MAADMEDAGLVVAADVRARRVQLLEQTVRASGARTIRVVRANAAGGLPFGAEFDRVLVDAPCSGLGTLRRDPDIKWRRREDEFPTLVRLQLQILDAAAGAVRPGGRLIYSTCSSEPEENDQVVAAFLEMHADFRASPLPALPPPAQALVDGAGRLRTLPFRDGLEAFFAAALVKAANLG